MILSSNVALILAILYTLSIILSSEKTMSEGYYNRPVRPWIYGWSAREIKPDSGISNTHIMCSSMTHVERHQSILKTSLDNETQRHPPIDGR